MSLPHGQTADDGILRVWIREKMWELHKWEKEFFPL
jgi:hypothetical protein